MAAACALAIFRGKIIFIFGIAERLRTLRYPIFTGGVVEENGICGAAGLHRPRRAADTDVTRKNSFIFGVQESLRVFLYPLFTVGNMLLTNLPKKQTQIRHLHFFTRFFKK